MIVPDANLLLYAVDETAARHGVAKAWLEATLSGSETVGLAWVVLLAFVRLTTNPRVFGSPLDVDEAIDYVEGWLAQPCATIIDPTPRHLVLMRDLLEQRGTGGNLTTDAHLAALAIEHGGRLVSADRDFAAFPGLDWRDPLDET